MNPRRTEPGMCMGLNKTDKYLIMQDLCGERGAGLRRCHYRVSYPENV